MSEVARQCRTCGREWCGHYGDQCDLPKTEMLPCKGADWILKTSLCPECGSEMAFHDDDSDLGSYNCINCGQYEEKVKE